MVDENKRIEKGKEQYENEKEVYYTSDGQEKVEVVEYRKYSDVSARIVGTDYIINTTMGHVKRNGISNPFANNSPIAFDTPADAVEGCIFTTNENYHIKVTKYERYDKVYYEFVDSESPCGGCTTIQNIKNGEVRNPFKPNKFYGYLGLDERYKNNEYRWLYNIWTNIVIRGYELNKEYYHKYRSTNVYDDTTIDPSWLNYSIFADWYMNQYRKLNHELVKDYALDKDILYRYYAKETFDQKCYGPNYCVLIPKDLNSRFSAPDIQERIKDITDIKPHLPEDHYIKTLAQFYADNNCITRRTLQAIMRL